MWTTIALVAAIFLFALAALLWLRRLRRDPRLTPPSLFTAIGFAIPDESALARFVNRIAQTGRPYPVTDGIGGAYYQLALADGVEFWTALNTDRLIEAATPFFRADNCNDLSIERPIPDSEWRYEGAFEARVCAELEVGAGARLVFACPDFLLHAGGPWPQPAAIALTAFLHEGELFDNASAFCEAEGDPNAPVFVCTPAGLLQFGRTPVAQTLLRGMVVESRLLKNAQTGNEFYWVRLNVEPLTIDLVGDPRLLAAPPQPGNVLEASVWLAGDWVEHETPRS
jgi:hypothetical protein